MYSRRFAEGAPDVPPDYGGVTYRKDPEKMSEIPEGQMKDLSDRMQEHHRPERPFSGRRAEKERRLQNKRPVIGTEPRSARRPLYSQICERKKCSEESRQETGQRSTPKNGGLLSSLFSLSGKSFSLEDLVLAGMILLLMSDRKNGEEPDGELLLILGLLLLT